ncbi:hypothetical protein GRP75_24700 [Paenibacillus sp. OT2-17]|jgi:hypothetical protein|uniref:hypothetical protein n=1 Tax=Paenibacillus sp. OT2-17 TaxID=2691605 RepID=UPI0013538285|nr:hypothetical protein [Paenibacillus sp. OT2-17]MXO80923.1 hypothetical protein [Paenibacillus sp. OT2-17]
MSEFTGIIDEHSEWLMQHYKIVPNIISRSVQVRLIVDGKEYAGGLDYARKKGE